MKNNSQKVNQKKPIPVSSPRNFNTMLPKYKRILLKLSGEALMGDGSFGFDTNVIAQYAQDIKSITDLGVQVAVVIGGGNIYRGMNEAETGIERAHGD